MITELTDINKNLMLSIDVTPVPMDEAIKDVENMGHIVQVLLKM